MHFLQSVSNFVTFFVHIYPFRLLSPTLEHFIKKSTLLWHLRLAPAFLNFMHTLSYFCTFLQRRRMITKTDEIYLIYFSKWDLDIRSLITISGDYIKRFSLHHYYTISKSVKTLDPLFLDLE